MKILMVLIVLTVSFTTFAGPGHGHSHGAPVISQEKTGVIGRKHVERLVKTGKIDASWKSAIFDKSEKKQMSHGKEWVVTFNNEKGVKGKKLYIFLKLSGEFIAANFSGK